jgi:hypothetical protein
MALRERRFTWMAHLITLHPKFDLYAKICYKPFVVHSTIL